MLFHKPDIVGVLCTDFESILTQGTYRESFRSSVYTKYIRACTHIFWGVSYVFKREKCHESAPWLWHWQNNAGGKKGNCDCRCGYWPRCQNKSSRRRQAFISFFTDFPMTPCLLDTVFDQERPRTCDRTVVCKESEYPTNRRRPCAVERHRKIALSFAST